MPAVFSIMVRINIQMLMLRMASSGFVGGRRFPFFLNTDMRMQNSNLRPQTFPKDILRQKLKFAKSPKHLDIFNLFIYRCKLGSLESDALSFLLSTSICSDKTTKNNPKNATFIPIWELVDFFSVRIVLKFLRRFKLKFCSLNEEQLADMIFIGKILLGF